MDLHGNPLLSDVIKATKQVLLRLRACVVWYVGVDISTCYAVSKRTKYMCDMQYLNIS